jgi:transposase InsO family protein
VSDITDIWTQEGWLYLAVVIDLFSRKVVGWSMSTKMKARLVCDALQMAVWKISRSRADSTFGSWIAICQQTVSPTFKNT